MPLIEVNDLRIHFHTENGIVKAVDGINFKIEPGKTLGIVGESGCGKSVTAMSIMGLIPMPPGKIAGGEVTFNRNGRGQVNLLELDPKGKDMRNIRGNEVAMIFQTPMSSLNPVYTIGRQISDAIMLHQDLKKRDANDKAIEMLKSVGIPSPKQRACEYPHQLSGGMCQRAMIALALSCNPSLLIADEPTTALDVTTQAQVLDLMNNLRDEFHTAIQFITHDLGIVAQMADDVVVMYLGKIVESADVKEIFHHPAHPYTNGLIGSIPTMTSRKKDKLLSIDGVVPDLCNIPPGCGFAPRCPKALDVCKKKSPPCFEISSGHNVFCWLYQ